MSYSLRFHEQALTEWRELDGAIREPLKKKLAERLENPRLPSAALHGMSDCYTIKLRGVGYRLIYRVDEAVVSIMVIAIGKRDNLKVYETARSRL
jgi:mRNA interferase RelE/StbE